MSREVASWLAIVKGEAEWTEMCDLVLLMLLSLDDADVLWRGSGWVEERVAVGRGVDEAVLMGGGWWWSGVLVGVSVQVI